MTDVRTARTAADLSAIVDLASTRRGPAGTSDRLLTQAVHLASARVDRSPLPGGAAMIALAPVADLEVWAARVSVSERAGVPAREVRTAADLEDEEAGWPPLQVLLFWSEQWRAHHAPADDVARAHGATLTSEAAFLRAHLDAAHQRLTTAEWTAFASDVAAARRRLEDVLADGDRVERGVPCMDPACRGRRLIRKLQPARDARGRRTWVHSEWHCASCRRRYGPVEYQRMVAAANARAQRETLDVRRDVLTNPDGTVMVIEDETTWCSVAWAANVVRRPESTLRSWVHRGDVATVCLVAGRRTGFVSLDDVLHRDDLARSRVRRTANPRPA